MENAAGSLGANGEDGVDGGNVDDGLDCGIEKAGELEFKMVAGKNQTATKNKI